MEELKPCPFCGHPRSRLMHRTEYRENAEGLTAEYDSYPGVWHEVKMLDFRHVFYRRCNKCGARGGYVKTDWHVRTEEETEDFTLCADQREKLFGFDPDSDWAKPWREQANDAWNRREKPKKPDKKTVTKTYTYKTLFRKSYFSYFSPRV